MARSNADRQQHELSSVACWRIIGRTSVTSIKAPIAGPVRTPAMMANQ